MSDHQIVLIGLWVVTAVCWGSRYVPSLPTLVMTGITLYFSFK